MTYIVDRDRKPLMPTKRGNVVRHLLKSGVAKVVRYEPFTVMILRDVGHCVQAVTLGVDTGSRHIGLSATTEKKELYSAQVELRTDVTKLLTARRELRRGRRGRKHNWYRPARWRNRANARAEHLPPSIRHKADSHIRAIKFVCKMLPVVHIRLEIGKFDSQKIANPSIKGEEYQQGTLANWENLKAYAKWRDGYKCRACGKSKHKDGVRLEVHHIRRKADGGTDTPDNVVTLCHDCHEAHHKGERKLKFRRQPQHKGEAHMNAMKDYLCDEVHGLYGERFDGVTYGYLTAMARREYGIDKSHENDAFCIAGNFWAKRNDYNIYLHRFVRRHDRSTHLQIIKSPRKLSKSVQKRLTEKEWKNGYRPPHRMLKVVKGFRRMDTVRYKGALWHLSSLRNTGSFKLMRHGDGVVKDGAGYRHLTRVCGACGTITTERITERRTRDSSQP